MSMKKYLLTNSRYGDAQIKSHVDYLDTSILKQNYESLLYWAKFCCEELNAQYARYSESDDPADQPPTWLAELSAACDSCEINGGEAIDHENA
jgi:hypothetical protein